MRICYNVQQFGRSLSESITSSEYLTLFIFQPPSVHSEMEVAELKMLRFSLGVTRMDKIRNEFIRGTAQVGKFGDKTRKARLRWYGHLRRKDDVYIGRRMLRMELPGKRKRGRPNRRFMDVVKEDVAEVEVTEEDTVDRNNWRRKIRCGDS